MALGAKSEPCGTPRTSGHKQGLLLLESTFRILLERYDKMILKALSQNLNTMIVFKLVVYGLYILSKALEKSESTIQVNLFLPIAFNISVVTHRNTLLNYICYKFPFSHYLHRFLHERKINFYKSSLCQNIQNFLPSCRSRGARQSPW